ncbi:MAG: hypothetical protein ACHQUC_01285 [Chlamydiales bacterium]
MIPESTRKRIESEADYYELEIFKDNPTGFHVAPYVNKGTLSDSYIAGATREFERAQKLVEALKNSCSCSIRTLFRKEMLGSVGTCAACLALNEYEEEK